MLDELDYGQEYFEGIYVKLKREKDLIFELFFNFLAREKSGTKKILDLGCGEGDFLKICQRRGLTGFGADISTYALDKARKNVKAKFTKIDLSKENLPYPNQFFDIVVSFDLVEHLANPVLVFKEAWRVLKKDGLLFLTTPNGGYWLADFFGIFIAGDVTHINIQNESYWQKRLKKAGFLKIKTSGCLVYGFPPIASLRHLLRKFKIPVWTKLIFFPIKGLTTELFIFARKV